MYLYNTDNYLRSIRREEIPNLLKELDANMKHIMKQFGAEGLDFTPFPDQNAVIISQTEKYYDRSFENPNKEIVSGLILYYTLVGTDICTYTMFRANLSEYDPLSENFGTIKRLGIENDSHFKKIREFTEKLRALYPKMMTVGEEVFYKNNYLLLNSYPATTRKRYEIAEALRKEDRLSEVVYHKKTPTVSFTYEKMGFDLLIRQDCILYNGIIYPNLEFFLQSLYNGFPIRIEQMIKPNETNANFIDFVKHLDISLEDFIFKEQTREMDESNKASGDVIF